MHQPDAAITYFASPYSHDDPEVEARRFEAVAWEAARLINEGAIVFCPITHSHPIATVGGVNGGWETWKRQDFALISRCDSLTILMLDGWRESVGVTAEEEYALSLGLAVWYRHPSPENPYL